MKAILISLIMAVSAIAMHAQDEVTKFLGIPVDGTKTEMIEKLKKKGFTVVKDNILTGEFNGRDVDLFVGTNNNKVYRIMVSDANFTSEAEIKIRFNNLVHQFENNSKYASCATDQMIPESEDISYEMTVHNKRYQATFCQPGDALKAKLWKIIEDKYTPEQLANLSDELKADLDEELRAFGVELLMEAALNRSVWFMIDKHYGQYGILLFYDNGYNRANGEDL